MNKTWACSLSLLISSILSVLLIPLEAKTQVVPDETLPVDSNVTQPEENTNIITGGTQAGDNLYHSFEQFSVPTGNTADFQNSSEIENIFTRVTGDSVSNIDGIIKANGAANLFLLNPSGILFGPNAQLDIGGSFVGTTADSIKFEDGNEFSAEDTQAEPILTVKVPIGLGFLGKPGDITVRGQGNNLKDNPQTAEVIRDNRPIGIQVNPAQTLALVGGNINLEGANLTAKEGKIELGSIGSEGIVNFSPTELGFRFDYENIRDFQNVNLLQAASVDVSGNGGGDIFVQGNRVLLDASSSVLAETFGSSEGGNIRVRATEALEIVGVNLSDSSNLPSGLFASAEPGATGNGGNIEVSTDTLRLADGGQIASRTYGAGNAGTIDITAGEIELVGVSPLNSESPSRLSVNTELGATGNGGNIQMNAERLRIADGARIANRTFSAGNAGTINITAQEIELVGINQSSPNSPSNLTASTELGATGNGGNIQMNAERLRIADGGRITSGTSGEGNAGTIDITAGEIEISGASQFGPDPSSRISANTFSTGNGGNIQVNAERLRITDGGRITSGASGEGNAGTIDITAGEIEIFGASQFGSDVPSPSRISANTGLTGSGGNIQVKAERLRIADRGRIATDSTGLGQTGDINLSAGDIVLSDNGNISTDAIGDTGGGNINIDTNTTIAIENSSITADAVRGRGGEVKIAANNGVFSSPNSEITAKSDLGIDGEVTISNEPTFGRFIKFDAPPAIDTKKLIADSCLDRYRKKLEFANKRGGVMPVNPDSGIDINETAPIPTDVENAGTLATTNSTGETVVYPSDNESSWTSGDPVIEANSIVQTPDGRILGVRKMQPEEAQSLVCH
jgi:filamentous hemagglutinin family protein